MLLARLTRMQWVGILHPAHHTETEEELFAACFLQVLTSFIEKLMCSLLQGLLIEREMQTCSRIFCRQQSKVLGIKQVSHNRSFILLHRLHAVGTIFSVDERVTHR